MTSDDENANLFCNVNKCEQLSQACAFQSLQGTALCHYLSRLVLRQSVSVVWVPFLFSQIFGLYLPTTAGYRWDFCFIVSVVYASISALRSLCRISCFLLCANTADYDCSMTYNDHFLITPSGSLSVDANADAHMWVTSSMVELLGDLNTSETTVVEFERTLSKT